MGVEESLGRPLDVLIGEGRHEVVRVVVVRLVADLHAGLTSFGGGSLEVLGEELALLVEVVAGTLEEGELEGVP